MSPVLEIEDLVVRYRLGGLLAGQRFGGPRHVEVLAGIDLELEAGRTLALVGESGSGKTTLGRAIVGLAPISRGVVRVDGRTAVGWHDGWGDGPWRAIRREVGLMFQDPLAALNPRMSVAALVTEPFAIHRRRGIDRRREATRLLDQVGLPAAFLERYPHQLSGGQARRVNVARALALRPKLVIADEPTAGLDLSIQGELLNLLARLQAESDVSYLLITHNLSVARHVSDTIAIMYLGRVVEIGPTEAIYRRPAHPYTHALLGARGAGPEGRRAALRGEVPSLRQRPPGCEFHTRCPLAQPRCRTDAPAKLTIATGHSVRCHFPLGSAVRVASAA